MSSENQSREFSKKVPSLDELYYMTAHIYSEQNAGRSLDATFTHFAEVCGMLTIQARNKKREGIDVDEALCKALGWFFPLMAKFRISSVEEIIYRKYPFVCPYCRLMPHKDENCKTTLGTHKTLNHEALQKKYEENKAKKPRTLNEWQMMFQEIYPRNVEDKRSMMGLFEELGEMAEAIRVYDRYPRYLVGEAADVFSYLMGVANEYMLAKKQQGILFSFEDEFIKRYPGLCLQCGYQVCICPDIPEATVGRLSKELSIADYDGLFTNDAEHFARKSSNTAREILKNIGGYEGLIKKFPFDRGEANNALVVLCLKLAEIFDTGGAKQLSSKLRSMALNATLSPSPRGSRHASEKVRRTVTELQEIWPSVLSELKGEITIKEEPLTETITEILKTKSVLLVFSCPQDEGRLQLHQEERVVREAIGLSKYRDFIVVTTLPAASIDDLRRALLNKEYDILHIAGHGRPGCLVLENERGEATEVSIAAFGDLVKRYPSVKCIILNNCYSLSRLNKSITDIIIGMEAAVSDDAAIEFVRGFYDALGAGKSYKFAYDEGVSAVDLKGLTNKLPIKCLLKP